MAADTPMNYEGDSGYTPVASLQRCAWFPSENKYRETHSDSYFLDFQSRRLNMKYKTKDGDTKFLHTLNNTVIATPRIIAAMLENYQNADGSVTIPKALRKYTGFNKIKPKAK